MDIQELIDTMNEQQAKTRSNYHLTLGELIKALKEAPSGAEYDERIKGIGSWRGSYTEIALFTNMNGFRAEREEFNGYGSNDFAERYEEWMKENVVSSPVLPKSANELGKLLESLIGLEFVGYKGGNFTIAEYKPLWLEEDGSTYSSIAVIGIDDNLKLITKEVD